MPIKQDDYYGGADDVLKDAIEDLEMVAEEEDDGRVCAGLEIAIDYLKDKRRELYS